MSKKGRGEKAEKGERREAKRGVDARETEE